MSKICECRYVTVLHVLAAKDVKYTQGTLKQEKSELSDSKIAWKIQHFTCKSDVQTVERERIFYAQIQNLEQTAVWRQIKFSAGQSDQRIEIHFIQHNSMRQISLLQITVFHFTYKHSLSISLWYVVCQFFHESLSTMYFTCTSCVYIVERDVQIQNLEQTEVCDVRSSSPLGNQIRE